MTDLISQLADAIIALINAKPQSPTNEEVAKLLCGYLLVEGGNICRYKFPGISPDALEAHNREWDQFIAEVEAGRAKKPCPIDHVGTPSGTHNWHSDRWTDGPDRCLCGATQPSLWVRMRGGGNVVEQIQNSPATGNVWAGITQD